MNLVGIYTTIGRSATIKSRQIVLSVNSVIMESGF